MGVTSESLYILRARPVVWMLVKLSRPRRDSPVMILVQKLAERLSRRTCRRFRLVAAVVIGITAWTVTVVAVGLTLHKEIQAAEFIQDCHKNSAELWTKRNGVDSEVVNETADLRQIVILMRDQLETLREQIKLKCNWNVTSYCSTPFRFNESNYDWERVKMPFGGHPNSFQMIYDLQQEIKETFKK